MGDNYVPLIVALWGLGDNGWNVLHPELGTEAGRRLGTQKDPDSSCLFLGVRVPSSSESLLANPVPHPCAPRPWGSSRTPLPPHTAGTQEMRGGAGMRRNLLGPSPRHPPHPHSRALTGPPRCSPTPCCPGRLGPDLRVAQGRGCWRRQRLGNILWMAGWTDQMGGSAPPAAGQKSAGGRVNMAQGSQTWGGGKEYTHTQSP